MSELVIAVDLGFSSTEESCGWAHKNGDDPGEPATENSTFGKLPEKIAEVISRGSRGNVVNLILEAPLQYAFSTQEGTQGNPVHRTMVFGGQYSLAESNLNPNRGDKGGRWYFQSGVLTAFSAKQFLGKLWSSESKEEASEEASIEIKLFEGFIATRRHYGGNRSKKEQHKLDAEYLVEAFCQTQGGHTNSDNELLLMARADICRQNVEIRPIDIPQIIRMGKKMIARLTFEQQIILVANQSSCER